MVVAHTAVAIVVAAAVLLPLRCLHVRAACRAVTDGDTTKNIRPPSTLLSIEPLPYDPMSAKINSSNPSELELNVSQALVDLESSVGDLKTALRPLQFNAAREIEVGKGKKAIVIFVPVPLLAGFQKIQQRLTRELEKKFSDRHVMFIAQRRILPKPGRRRSRQKQQRPRSRTLTAVHEAMLDDMVFPTEIVGRRVRVQEGGRRIQKIFLDSKDAAAVDYKLESFQAVYGKLTGKSVVFEIPSVQAETSF